jgi:hypothetical protein
MRWLPAMSTLPYPTRSARCDETVHPDLWLAGEAAVTLAVRPHACRLVFGDRVFYELAGDRLDFCRWPALVRPGHLLGHFPEKWPGHLGPDKNPTSLLCQFSLHLSVMGATDLRSDTYW